MFLDQMLFLIKNLDQQNWYGKQKTRVRHLTAGANPELLQKSAEMWLSPVAVLEQTSTTSSHVHVSLGIQQHTHSHSLSCLISNADLT